MTTLNSNSGNPRCKLFSTIKELIVINNNLNWFWKWRSLETNGRLMELNHGDGKLYVNYGDRLVTLLREVRLLSGMGFAVPPKIQRVSDVGDKFYRHGVILKQVKSCSNLICCARRTVLHECCVQQVAHFYNTIDHQMIACQKSMMLHSAIDFERIIKNPRTGSTSTFFTKNSTRL